MYAHHHPLGNITVPKRENHCPFLYYGWPPSTSPFLDNVQIQADFSLLTFPFCNKTVSAPLIKEPPPSSFTTSHLPPPKKKKK